MTEQQIEIVDAPESQRFEALLDGELVGFADYRDRDGVRVFPHTEVRPEHGDRGIGSTLVDEALRATIAAGLRFDPQCPFVAARAEADEFAVHAVR